MSEQDGNSLASMMRHWATTPAPSRPQVFQPIDVSCVVVEFSTLLHSPGFFGEGIEQEFTVSSIKSFDEALAEALAFIDIIRVRAFGKVHSLRAMLRPGRGPDVDIPIPPPRRPSDTDMRRFAVGWEEKGREYPPLQSPLVVFEVAEHQGNIPATRMAALLFVRQVLTTAGHDVVFFHGHDGAVWHRLGWDGLLLPSNYQRAITWA